MSGGIEKEVDLRRARAFVCDVSWRDKTEEAHSSFLFEKLWADSTFLREKKFLTRKSADPCSFEKRLGPVVVP